MLTMEWMAVPNRGYVVEGRLLGLGTDGVIVGRLDGVDDGMGVGAIKYERRIYPLSHTTGPAGFDSGRL